MNKPRAVKFFKNNIGQINQSWLGSFQAVIKPLRKQQAMKIIEKHQIQDHIEGLIDRHSLNYVLNCVAQICFEKADHVQSTWNDKPLSDQLEKTAVLIEQIADKNENL